MTVHDIDLESSPKDWPTHWKELTQKSSLTFESQHKAADGRVFPVEITANYVEFGDQEYNFAFARDISRRKELERRLGQAHRPDGAGTLAGGVAQDLASSASYRSLATHPNHPVSGAVTVLLGNDDDVVRRGLKDALESLRGIAVVGEAVDGEEAIRKVQNRGHGPLAGLEDDGNVP